MLESSVNTIEFAGRRRFLLLMLIGLMFMLLGRAVHLQVFQVEQLKSRVNMRHIREVVVSTTRGPIVDRYGEPLAISTPVDTIWMDPKFFKIDSDQIKKLARLLDKSTAQLNRVIERNQSRRFVYLKRRANPPLAAQVADLKIDGVFSKREYKRYYPAGEVSAHLVGFTNIDDMGQEGMELAYQNDLSGVPGKKAVILDGSGKVVEDIENIESRVPGRELRLTIDKRLQFLAYRELKAAYKKHKAKAASLVMLDARNGDVLAMVNQPSFNPNSRKNLNRERFRNRAITDVFEPGSTMKPFVVACALEQGIYNTNTIINTSPGTLPVGRNLVRDSRDYGALDLMHILQKSSNVGASIIGLSLSPVSFWGCYDRLGFGHSIKVGFPGEATGRLLAHEKWHPIEQATLSYGYGLSGSALHLARAYSALANDGEMVAVRLKIGDQEQSLASRVMSSETAGTVRSMLEHVVSREGTAYKASVPGYRVAGKTGTVKKVGPGGYLQKSYLALFAGMAPASNPRIVTVVVFDEPRAGKYYGGAVAAPVFSGVMSAAFRILGIPPDEEQTMPFVQVKLDDAI